MRLEISALPRSADSVDLSSATTATRTGPATWIEPGVLDVPFNRGLTSTEVAAVTLLLTSATDATAELRAKIETYLAIGTPTTANNTAVLQALARLALEMLDQK